MAAHQLCLLPRPFGAFGESVLRDFSAPTDNKTAQAQREVQRSASASEK